MYHDDIVWDFIFLSMQVLVYVYDVGVMLHKQYINTSTNTYTNIYTNTYTNTEHTHTPTFISTQNLDQ